MLIRVLGWEGIEGGNRPAYTWGSMSEKDDASLLFTFACTFTRRPINLSRLVYMSVSFLKPRTSAAVLGMETVGGTAPLGVHDEKDDASYRTRSCTSYYF